MAVLIVGATLVSVCSSFFAAWASCSSIVNVLGITVLPEGAETFKGPRPSFIAGGGFATLLVPFLQV